MSAHTHTHTSINSESERERGRQAHWHTLHRLTIRVCQHSSRALWLKTKRVGRSRSISLSLYPFPRPPPTPNPSSNSTFQLASPSHRQTLFHCMLHSVGQYGGSCFIFFLDSQLVARDVRVRSASLISFQLNSGTS